MLEGTLGTLIDDRLITAAPGTWVVKPRNQWHTFFNPADVPCRTIEVVSPAAFQHYFDELAPLGGRIDALPQLNEKYAIDMDVASVPALSSRLKEEKGQLRREAGAVVFQRVPDGAARQLAPRQRRAKICEHGRTTVQPVIPSVSLGGGHVQADPLPRR